MGDERRQYESLFMRVQGYYLAALALLAVSFLVALGDGDWRVLVLAVLMVLAAVVLIVRSRARR